MFDIFVCAWSCPVVELSSYCGVVQSKAPVYRNSKDMKEGKGEGKAPRCGLWIMGAWGCSCGSWA